MEKCPLKRTGMHRDVVKSKVCLKKTSKKPLSPVQENKCILAVAVQANEH